MSDKLTPRELSSVKQALLNYRYDLTRMYRTDNRPAHITELIDDLSSALEKL